MPGSAATRPAAMPLPNDDDDDPFTYHRKFDDGKMMADNQSLMNEEPEMGAVDDSKMTIQSEAEPMVIPEERALFPVTDLHASLTLISDEDAICEESDLQANLVYRDTRETSQAHSRHASFLTADTVFFSKDVSSAWLSSVEQQQHSVSAITAASLELLIGRQVYVETLHQLMTVHFHCYHNHDCVDPIRNGLPTRTEAAGSWLAKKPLSRLHSALHQYRKVLDESLLRYLKANGKEEGSVAISGDDDGYQTLANMINVLKLVTVLFTLPFGANEESILNLPFDEQMETDALPPSSVLFEQSDHRPQTADKERRSSRPDCAFSESFGRRNALIKWLEDVVRPGIDARIERAFRRLGFHRSRAMEETDQKVEDLDHAPDMMNDQLLMDEDKEDVDEEEEFETLSVLNQDNTECSILFLLLTANRIDEAVKQAMDFGNLRMATLIAQSRRGGEVAAAAAASSLAGYQPCLLVSAQIDQWKKDKSWQQFSEYRRRVYLVLSGEYAEITRLGHMSWQQCLLLVLSHSTCVSRPLSEVLRRFTKDFTKSADEEKVVTAPLVTFDAQQQIGFQPSASDDDAAPKKPRDLCFELLRLQAGLVTAENFADRSKSPLLNPYSYQPSDLEFSLCWLLQDLLFDAGVLQGYLPPHHRIHLQFSTQLESAGLWHWAIYVALHSSYHCRRMLGSHPICNSRANALLHRHIVESVLALTEPKPPFSSFSDSDDAVDSENADDADMHDQSGGTGSGSGSGGGGDSKSERVLFEARIEFDPRAVTRLSRLWKQQMRMFRSLPHFCKCLKLRPATVNAWNLCVCAGLPIACLLAAVATAWHHQGTLDVSAVNLYYKCSKLFHEFEHELRDEDCEQSAALKEARTEAARNADLMAARALDLFCYRVLPTSVLYPKPGESVLCEASGMTTVRKLAKLRDGRMAPLWNNIGQIYQDFFSVCLVSPKYRKKPGAAVDGARVQQALELATKLRMDIEVCLDRTVHPTDKLSFDGMVWMQRALDDVIVSFPEFNVNFH